nr:DNA topoisomerase [Peptoniphilus timonensis]
MPILEKGEEFPADFQKIEKMTSPPKKITEATLFDYLADPVRYDKELNKKYNEAIEGKIKLLKDSDDELDLERPEKGLQIGTQASRTNIFENTIKYGYISKNGKTLSITKKGENLINILDEMSINLYASKSVEFESMLIDVKTGKMTVDDSVKSIVKDLNNIINGAKDISFGNKYSNAKIKSKLIGDCPKCGKHVFAIKAKNGYIYKCENNECNFIFYSKQKRFNDIINISVKDAQKLLQGKNILANLTNKEGKKYDAFLKLNAGEKYVNFDFDGFPKNKKIEVLGTCPDCGKKVLALPMKKGGTFFICENKESCDFRFSTKFMYFGDPVNISLEQAKDLLEGKSIKVELHTVSGKKYVAEVKMVFNNGYANLEKIRNK